ncbi:MAG: potassium transporter Kup [Deltaproteobacteria bacterium]|nr:potassium transporter Kup [Deltaproteobacteria bacterium]
MSAPSPAVDGHAGDHGHGPKGSTAILALGALGVVYGDIGTSPLYALKECVALPHGVNVVEHGIGQAIAGAIPGGSQMASMSIVNQTNIFGLLSLIFWSITLVVVFKYLIFVLRADNRGEGGVLALLALVAGDERTRSNAKKVLVLAGLFGAALLYGDGMITPAISVLSAVEGLKVATHTFEPYVIPITCGILIGLFLVQKRGTAGIGKVFGPVTMLWFISIGVLGIPWIVGNPAILRAINPQYAVEFFIANKWHGFLVLGSVVLCITGGEALYADMGHFGRKSIRVAWYAVVFPALLLNYFGQGAMLLKNPAAAHNPFFELVPHALLYPMVALATTATVVASQALISGAFSLTRQAVQLGYSPRVTIIHTSGEAEGQIYIPEVNNILMVACIGLVLSFQESGRLAAAYGIAVTGTMGITSMLFYVVARERWKWPLGKALGIVALFLIFDLAFFTANAAKFMHGGWFPIAVAAAMYIVMTTWKRGRALLNKRIQEASLPLDLFMNDLETQKPHRVSGTAVFMTSNPTGTPVVLLHHFKHNKVLHEQVVLLSIVTERVPEVPASERLEVKEHGMGFWQVTAYYGFMQTPNVPQLLSTCKKQGLKIKDHDTSYYLGRETLLASKAKGLARWRKTLFGFLSRNARTATAFFGIPPNRVVEIGAQIEL